MFSFQKGRSALTRSQERPPRQKPRPSEAVQRLAEAIEARSAETEVAPRVSAGWRHGNGRGPQGPHKVCIARYSVPHRRSISQPTLLPAIRPCLLNTCPSGRVTENQPLDILVRPWRRDLGGSSAGGGTSRTGPAFVTRLSGFKRARSRTYCSRTYSFSRRIRLAVPRKKAVIRTSITTDSTGSDRLPISIAIAAGVSGCGNMDWI
jgi:hypothetical protein